MQGKRDFFQKKIKINGLKDSLSLAVSEIMSNFATQKWSTRQRTKYITINNKKRQWKEHFSLTTEEEWTSTASVREWLPKMVVACWLPAALMAARSWPFLTSITANKPSRLIEDGKDMPLCTSMWRQKAASDLPNGHRLLFSYYGGRVRRHGAAGSCSFCVLMLAPGRQRLALLVARTGGVATARMARETCPKRQKSGAGKAKWTRKRIKTRRKVGRFINNE